jgi:flavin-binding protein dodecin
MKHPVSKLIEVTGTSAASLEDVLAKAHKRLHRLVRHPSWFQVVETHVNIDMGKVRHWQVKIRVGLV